MYKLAAQKKLRFACDRGNLTVEQLFDLPLTELDSIARGINTELKGVTEETFIPTAKPDPRKAVLQTSLDLLKDVIKTKVDEADEEKAKAERTVKRRKILDAINAKDDAALTSASKASLLKQLAELD